MNLNIISPSFYPSTYYGGPSLSVYYLARALSLLLPKLSVITTDANGKESLNVTKNKFVELEKNLYVKYYSNSTSFGLSMRMALNLWKDIKENELTYIVSFFSPSTPEALLFASFFKKKIILSPRGQLSDWAVSSRKSFFKNLWIKFLIKPYQSKIVWHATSEQERVDIKTVFEDANVFAIPNGINVEEYNKTNKDQNYFSKFINEPEKQIIISSMGRLHNVKGFDILIESIEILFKNSFKVYLFIAGEDNGELKRLKELVSQKKLNEYVFFVGHLSGANKVSFLSNSNLFALASHSENFGLVYAEALACGVPIVASINTPWQIVNEFNCGKWIPNTADKFAKAIEEIIVEKDKSMEIRCRKLIEENFSWEIIAKKMKIKFEEIYNGK